MTDQVNEAVAKVIFTNRKKPDVEWLVDTVKLYTLLYAHPSRGVVDEATWHCTNCRTRFAATAKDWKRIFDRCAPACPYCKAHSQYTYPIGVGGLVDKLEHMGFSCQGGPLANSTEWGKVKEALQAAALPAVPSDEWKDRLATALDDLANPTGLIYFANGRVIGSRQFYIHVVHGEALPVRFADPAHQPAVPYVPEGMAEFDSIAVGVRQSLADGDGFWHPCSGCYETEDGQAVGHYPYSATFQCTLGGGCSECGGLGAVWDNNDYNAMLAATPKDQPAQEVG